MPKNKYIGSFIQKSFVQVNNFTSNMVKVLKYIMSVKYENELTKYRLRNVPKVSGGYLQETTFPSRVS